MLLCICIDVLLRVLESSNIGCSIGNIYLGCVAYVDHVCLLAPSCQVIRKMLPMCGCFGRKYKVNFNSTKRHVTVCHVTVCHVTVCHVTVCHVTVCHVTVYHERLDPPPPDSII